MNRAHNFFLNLYRYIACNVTNCVHNLYPAQFFFPGHTLSFLKCFVNFLAIYYYFSFLKLIMLFYVQKNVEISNKKFEIFRYGL